MAVKTLGYEIETPIFDGAICPSDIELLYKKLDFQPMVNRGYMMVRLENHIKNELLVLSI